MKKAKKILASVRQAGFTMVELLIVIAILGILTVAVLSAINPIEQINRGRDTGSRSDAEQIISAIDRYYTSNGYYPWMENTNDTTTDTPSTTGTLHSDGILMTITDGNWAQNGTNACPVLDLLSSATAPCEGADELKEAFVDRLLRPNTNALYVYNEGGRGDSTYVCFSPKSSAFLSEANERCADGLPDDLDAAAGVVCPGGTGQGATFSEDALICLP